jgi:hypothetical protein
MPVNVSVEDTTVRKLLPSTLSQLEIAPLQVEELMETPGLTHNAAEPLACLPSAVQTAGAAAAKSAGILLDLNGQRGHIASHGNRVLKNRHMDSSIFGKVIQASSLIKTTGIGAYQVDPTGR